MKLPIIAVVAAVAMGGAAQATSFSMTTEFDGGIGFIDTDSISVVGEIGKAITYTVWKTDQPVPKVMNNISGDKYAATASETWFQCTTRHYIFVNLFVYNDKGGLIASYDKPITTQQPIVPQTGLEEQYNLVCRNGPRTNQINNFGDFETPLQAIIRAGRATLNDPRYVAP